MGFFSKLFDKNEKEIKKYREIVKKINALESHYSKKTNTA